MGLTKIETLAITVISLISFILMPCTQFQAQAKSPAKAPVVAQAKAAPSKVSILAAKAPNLDPKVLKLALTAHQEAKAKGLVKRPILTVIDYSKTSIEKRLWVFDLSKNKLIFETHVTHGENSGKIKSTRFSNINGSHQSSLGVFTTGETYYGSNGYSLRLDGHEKGVNSLARKRAIVVHGADYASEKFIKRNGRLGLSWACPAVDSKIARKLIDTIKNGSLIFAYYPDQKWLKSSSFLKI